MTKDSKKSIRSSFKRFSLGTLISRATGLGREVAMAAAFGAAPHVAAFWMAFRFSHLLRRVFGEGALHAAFVPHFESVRKEDKKKGAAFFYHLSMTLALLLFAIVVLAEITLGSLLIFAHFERGTIEIIELTMLLLPSLIFICLFALNQAFLNCEKSFFVPSVAPALFNLIWIGAVFLFYKNPEVLALKKLAMVIVFAFAAQWLFTMPRVWRHFTTHLKGVPDRGNVKELLVLLAPFLLGVIGVAATQINSAFDALFARSADPSGPAYLWYAIRLQQLPLAFFGVGLAGALLPPISRSIENNQMSQSVAFVKYAINKGGALMLLSTAFFFALAPSLIGLVYAHGAFSNLAVSQTALCLFAYSIALFPMFIVLVVASAFYAQKNYKIPSFTSVGCVVLNIFLNGLFVFVFHMGAFSIALATAISAIMNAALLTKFYGEGVLVERSLLKMAIGSTAAVLVVRCIPWPNMIMPLLFLAKGALFFGIVATIYVPRIRKQLGY